MAYDKHVHTQKIPLLISFQIKSTQKKKGLINRVDIYILDCKKRWFFFMINQVTFLEIKCIEIGSNYNDLLKWELNKIAIVLLCYFVFIS